MRDYNYYIKFLSEELRRNYIKLANLPSGQIKLKESDFVTLGKKIKEKLTDIMSVEQKKHIGCTISASTVERLLKSSYTVKKVPDKRSKDTLNKVALFLGYRDWLDYIEKINQLFSGKDVEEVTELLRTVSRKTIECFKRLPVIDTKEIEPYYSKNSLAYQRLNGLLYASKEYQVDLLTGMYLQSPDSLIMVENYRQPLENLALVNTTEFWDVWVSTKKAPHDCYLDMKACIYVVAKVHNEWKIVDKYAVRAPYDNLNEDMQARLTY